MGREADGGSSAEVEDPLVPVGVLTRPHGLRGELRVHLYNDESALLYARDRVFLLREGEPPREQAVEVRRGPKGPLLRVDGVTSPEGAEAYRGVELAFHRSDFPDIDDGFYFVDLIGLEVLQDGKRIGEVRDVIEYPSIECLEVPMEDGVREIPLVEPWVIEVRLDDGQILVGDLSDVPVRP